MSLDAHVNRWLTKQHAAMIGDLAALLDLNAGLREVLIAEQHDDLVNSIRRTLDLDAGLATISGPTVPSPTREPASPRQRTRRSSQDDAQTPPSEVARALEALDPHTRLVQRNHPAVIAFALTLELHRARARSNDLTLTLELHRARARSRANDLDRDLGDLARDLGELAHDLELAHELAHDLGDFELAHELAHDLDLARDLARARTLDHEVARASDQIFDNLAHDLDLDLDRVSGRALARARHLAHDHEFAVALDRELADALDRKLADAWVRSLNRARNDFSGADLRSIDLTQVDLEGVRWSVVTTQWPAEWVDEIQRESVEIEPGLFEIRRGSSHTPAWR